MKPIYTYLNYREYLRDQVEALKAKSSAFSYRYFARKVGFNSPNFLWLVIQNKRNLSSESIAKFAAFFKLNTKEEKFFEILVQYNQAKNPQDQQKYYEELLAFPAFAKVYHLAREQYDFLAKWYYPAILELLHVAGQEQSPPALAAALRHEITAKQAGEALAALNKLGLIEQKSGVYVSTNAAISTGHEITALTALEYHQQILNLAKKAVQEQNVEQRELNAFTFAVNENQLPKIKELIRDFSAKFIHLLTPAEDKPAATSVYQMSIQLFALTTPTQMI